MKSKRSQVTIYLVWFFVATVIVLIGSVVAPIGAAISTQFYTAGQTIMIQGNSTAANILDPNVKSTIQNDYAEALSQTVTNISVATDLYQYSWVMVLVVSLLVLFLFTRKLVEYDQGRGLI